MCFETEEELRKRGKPKTPGRFTWRTRSSIRLICCCYNRRLVLGPDGVGGTRFGGARSELD